MTTALALTTVGLLFVAILILERMRQIIYRYEKLLADHDIPHSRRPNGRRGFYSHAGKPEGRRAA